MTHSNLAVESSTLIKTRAAAITDRPSIFAHIYEEDVNIAVWQRALSDAVKEDVNRLLAFHSTLQKNLVAEPQNVFDQLASADRGLEHAKSFCQNIAELVDMFCFLFKLKEVGVRLAIVDRAMCPKFHVDRVPCRLVSTYHGPATQWLPHNVIDRSKLGRGSNGLPDEESGLFQNKEAINQLQIGDVALLKGELWQGNENAGLVHRSPEVQPDDKRLLLTVDFFD